MRTITPSLIIALLCPLPWFLGCSPTASPPPSSSAAGHGHEGHDHGPGEHGHDHDQSPKDGQGHAGHGHADHGHSHAELGPNRGHLLELGDEQYHAEWVHDDESGKLTVYILDGAVKELVPIAAEKLTIEKKVGERTDRFELVAVDRQGEMPKTAKFEIVDKALIEALKLVGDGVEATLSVDVNGMPFTVPFTKDHGGHAGHKH